MLIVMLAAIMGSLKFLSVGEQLSDYSLNFASIISLTFYAVMDRWTGVLKVPVGLTGRTHCRVGVSLCLSPASRTLTVPYANAIFFNGDRVEGTGNCLIDRLTDLQKIAEILVSKLGGCVNAWVVEASLFNGPFAVYKDYIPSVNQYGEPKLYSPVGFPASLSVVSLLSNCLQEANITIPERLKDTFEAKASTSNFFPPKTFILGFSKGGTVVNQLVTELAYSEVKPTGIQPHREKWLMNGKHSKSLEENQYIPNSKESLLDSITDIHYVDVGLNSAGAYLTDHKAIERITRRLVGGATGIRFVIHGTPRQWCDKRRVWIQNEKDKLVQLLESEAQKCGGKLLVCERFYFSDRHPDMQMHFEIIDNLEVS